MNECSHRVVRRFFSGGVEYWACDMCSLRFSPSEVQVPDPGRGA